MEIVKDDIRKRTDHREVFRYLGYGAKIPDDTVRMMAGAVLDELISVAEPKNVYRRYRCQASRAEILLEDDRGAQAVFRSRDLAGDLARCKDVVLIAATLGIGADKLMQRYEISDMAKAAVAQACGAACIEAYCDILQERICEEASSGGTRYHLRPRFSPGYGDLPLEGQRMVFRMLDCTRRIGLTLTDSLLMYPTKSVTAFIGLTADPMSCHIDRCGTCTETACPYRV